MELPYTIYPFLSSGPTSGQLSTGAMTLEFQPSGIPSQFDNLVPHIAGLRLQVRGRIVQAAGGPAVRTDDWALLPRTANASGTSVEGQGLQFTANGETPLQLSFLSALRIMQSLDTRAGAFNDLSQFGPSLPAPGAAPVTTAVVLNFPVHFFCERWVDPFRFVKPAQWWSQGTLNFQFSDPATALHSSITWAAPPTVRLVYDLLLSPNIIMGAPFQWTEKITTGTGSATSQLTPGVYQTGGYLSPAFGGDSGFCSDDLVPRVQQIFNPEFPLRYPTTELPLDYGARQNAAGAVPGRSPFGADFSGDIIPLSTRNAPRLSTIQLFGPRWSGDVGRVEWDEYILDKQINWTVNVDPTVPLTAQHQFYFARSLSRTGCGVTSLAGPAGDEVKNQIRASLAGCSDKFSNFVPYIPPGLTAPAVALLGRSTLVSYRSA